jgi:hypothetical protein
MAARRETVMPERGEYVVVVALDTVEVSLMEGMRLIESLRELGWPGFPDLSSPVTRLEFEVGIELEAEEPFERGFELARKVDEVEQIIRSGGGEVVRWLVMPGMDGPDDWGVWEAPPSPEVAAAVDRIAAHADGLWASVAGPLEKVRVRALSAETVHAKFVETGTESSWPPLVFLEGFEPVVPVERVPVEQGPPKLVLPPELTPGSPWRRKGRASVVRVEEVSMVQVEEGADPTPLVRFKWTDGTTYQLPLSTFDERFEAMT